MALGLGLGLGLSRSVSNPGAADIALGARLIVDPQGESNGGNPYYWYRGTRYSSISNIPGWTFTRASGAYAPTASGSLVWFAANEPRITDAGFTVEGAATNLLTYSQDFSNAAWAKTATTITANATVAPDGTTTADLLTVAVTNAEHHVSQGSLSVVNGTAYTVSVFAKAGTENVLFLWNSQGGSMGSVNLSTGAVTGGVTAQLSGNGLYRVQATFTASATTTREIRFYIKQTTAYTGAGESLSLWGAQVETGTQATTYIPTTTTAVTRAADNPYIADQGGAVRTNLLLQSQTFDNAAWTKTRANVTADQTTAPDGTLTADLVVPTAVSGTHLINQDLSVSAGTTSLSWYIKPSGYAKYGFRENIGTGFAAAYDLSGAGSVLWTSGPVTAAVQASDDGWYRISISWDVGAGTRSFALYNLSPSYTTGAFVSDNWTPNGTSGAYYWGADLKAGALSAYIPTTGSPVTVRDPFTGIGRELGQFRTNLLLQSQTLDDAYWTSASLSVTANQIAAPDGTTTADLLTSTASNACRTRPGLFTVTSGLTCTFSTYLKAGNTNGFISLDNLSGGVYAYVKVDLSTGATTIGGANAGTAKASAIALSDGWYRVSLTLPSPVASITTTIGTWDGSADQFSYPGTNAAGKTVYAWGAQLETGPVATDYIPTTTAAVTVGNPFTMAVEAYLPAGDGTNRYLAALDLATPEYNNRVALSRDAIGTFANAYSLNGGTISTMGPSSAKGGARVLKGAIRLQPSTGRASFDGVLTSSVGLTPPSSLSRLTLGLFSAGGSNFLNGQIRKLVLYGDLTDAQLPTVPV